MICLVINPTPQVFLEGALTYQKKGSAYKGPRFTQSSPH